MNYFELYNLPVSFVDAAEVSLKKKYRTLSKKYHPDFFTAENEAEQQEALELTALNNQAIKVLGNLQQRIAYVLELKGLIKQSAQNEQLPPAFLMEMMELNEAMMELEFDADEATYQQVKTEIANFEQNINDSLTPLLASYSAENEGVLEEIKSLYYKKKYLLRLQENLSKFAVQFNG